MLAFASKFEDFRGVWTGVHYRIFLGRSSFPGGNLSERGRSASGMCHIKNTEERAPRTRRASAARENSSRAVTARGCADSAPTSMLEQPPRVGDESTQSAPPPVENRVSLRNAPTPENRVKHHLLCLVYSGTNPRPSAVIKHFAPMPHTAFSSAKFERTQRGRPVDTGIRFGLFLPRTSSYLLLRLIRIRVQKHLRK